VSSTYHSNSREIIAIFAEKSDSDRGRYLSQLSKSVERVVTRNGIGVQYYKKKIVPSLPPNKKRE
jgi:hypothetical protein